MVIGNHPLFQTREDLVFSQYKTIGLQAYYPKTQVYIF